MKTEDLVATLAAQARPVQPAQVARRLQWQLAAAVALSLLLMLALLGPRPDLAAASALPMFWAKLGLPAAVLAAAWLLVRRLGHPGLPLGRAPLGIALPVLAIWVAGAIVLLRAPAGARMGLVLGQTWLECLLSVPLLALPALALAFAALRRLAPTRPVAAGAAAGLFAGAAGALAYALHCPELEAPFLAVWYVAGMLTPALAGALLARPLLRW